MTTQIKYVGLKDAEAAFQDKTGIVWTPGSSHPIESALASRMLQHPDVFAEDTSETGATKATTSAVGVPLSSAARVDAKESSEVVSITLEDGTTEVLTGLDVAALKALAKKLGVSHHPNAGAAKITAALQAAFPAV